MPDFRFAPAWSLLTAFRSTSLRSLNAMMRAPEAALLSACAREYCARPQRARSTAKQGAAATSAARAVILREPGRGRVPTVVLGGLVPDAFEQVFLLRRFLLKSGDVYYVHYPRDGFSLEMLCAQLSDLVQDLSQKGQPPVVFAVSFGAGIVMEWLRRCRIGGDEPLLAGLVLVSPVGCVGDLVGVGKPKPSTLIGRALKPVLTASENERGAAVEKGRTIFLRMFGAGAQNKEALRLLMSPAEALQLHETIAATIRDISACGGAARVRALAEMKAPNAYFSPEYLPLSSSPTLVLFAEREEAVLDPQAPTRFALERAPHAYFAHAVVQTVTARAGETPVQHASLIFHAFEFLPHLQRFYQRVRRRPLALAA